jgi:hypothetical protein
MRKIRKRKDRTKQREAMVENSNTSKVLKCPFCKTPLSGCLEIETPFGDTTEGGFCGCGTTFIYDRSGRKLGDAYMEALAMAYKWDYDAALKGADGGFNEAVVRYDPKFRKYFIGDGDRSDRNPKYYFIQRKRKPQDQQK